MWDEDPGAGVQGYLARREMAEIDPQNDFVHIWYQTLSLNPKTPLKGSDGQDRPRVFRSF